MRQIIFGFLFLMVNDEAIGRFIEVPDVLEANDIRYTRQQIIEMLVHENPHNLQINYKDKTYDAKDFLGQHPMVPSKGISLSKNGNLLDLDIDENFFMIPFPTPNYVTAIEVNGNLYSPKDTLEVLASDNPLGVQISHNGVTYSAEEFLQSHGNIPNFSITHIGEEIEPGKLADYVPYPDGSTLFFQPVTVHNVKYEAKDVVELLAQNNPEHLKIKHNNHAYTPKEYRNKFGRVPENFQLMLNDEVLEQDDSFKYIPWPKPSFEKAEISKQILTPQLVIEGLAKNNPHALKVSHGSDILTPQQFLKRHKGGVPKNFQLMTEEDKVISGSELMHYLKSLLDGGKKTPNFPVIKYGQQKFSPKETIGLLSQTNPDNLQVVHHGQNYSPQEFLQKHPRGDIPQDFEIYKDGKPLNFYKYPKYIPFPKTYQVNREPMKLGGFSPQEVIEKLAEKKSADVKIFHNGVLYTPQEFLEAFGKVPNNFRILSPKGEVQKDLDLFKIIPQLKNDKPQPHVIKVDGKTYNAKNIIDFLIDYNPHRIIIKYKDKNYTPEEFADEFQRIPDDVNFTQDGNQIDFFDLPEYVPAMKPKIDEIKDDQPEIVEIEPTPEKHVTIDQQSVPIKDVLEKLIRHDFKNIRVRFNNRVVTPEGALNISELPDDVEFVMPDGKAVEPDQLPQLTQTRFDVADPRIRVDTQLLRYPSEIVSALTDKNPNRIKIRHDNKDYTVHKFIKAFPEIPDDIEFINKHDNPIKPNNLAEEIPGLKEYDSRIITGDKNKPVYPSELLGMLIKDNPNNLKIKYNNHKYKPEDLYDMLPSIPGTIEFIDDDDNPIDENKLPAKIPELNKHEPTVNVKNNQYDPTDLIKIIEKNNPKDVLIRFENRTLPPEVFLKAYPHVPKNVGFVSLDGSEIPLDELPNYVPQLNNGIDHQIDNDYVSDVVINEQIIPREELVDNLAENNPKDYLIKINNEKLTPSEAREKYPKDMPPFKIVQGNGEPAQPEKIIPEIIGIPGIYSIEPDELQLLPEITKHDIEKLKKNNPENAHFLTDNYILTPDEFLENYPNGIPEDLKLVDAEGDQIDQNTANKILGKKANALPKIIHNDIEYTPRDVVRRISEAGNPQNIKILIDGKPYKPQAALNNFRKMFPKEVTIVNNNEEPVDYKEIPKIMGEPQKYRRNKIKNFPSLTIEGVQFKPDDTVRHLAENNPENVKILHEVIIYTPQEMIDNFPEKIPHNYQIIDQNDEPIKTSLIPTILGFGGKFSHKKHKVQSPATKETIEQLQEDNPNHYRIKVGAKTYKPEEILNKFEDNIPEDAIIVNKNNEPVQPEEQAPNKNSFPIIALEGQTYTPEDVIKILSKNNPRDVKIVTNGKIFTPEDFLEAYPDELPEDINIIKPDNNPITNEEIPAMLGLEEKNYNEVPYKPEDVLRELVKSNPDKIAVADGKHKLTPGGYMAEHPGKLRKNTEFIKENGEPLNDDEIKEILNKRHPIPDAEYKANIYTPDEILLMLSKKNPSNLSVKYNGKKYDPKDFLEQFPDGVANEEIVLIDPTDNYVEPDELPAIIQEAIPTFPHISYEGKEYPPEDVLKLLAKNNLKNYKVRTISGKTYTPQEFLDLDQNEAEKNQFELVQNDLVVLPEDVAEDVPWEDNLEPEFPNIIHNQKEYSPDELLKLLSGNNPNKLKVSFDGKKYTPEKYLEEHGDDFPKNFEMIKNGITLSPDEVSKGIPWPRVDDFPTFSIGAEDYPPDYTIKSLSKNNPNSYLVVYNGKTYRPEDFLAEHPDVPQNFAIKQGGKLADPDSVIKSVLSTNDYPIINFPTIEAHGIKYQAHETLKILAKNNLKNLKVIYQGKQYTPQEFQNLGKPMPLDFELAAADGAIISPYDAINYIAWPGAKGKSKIPFPILDIYGKKFFPQDTIEILAKNNARMVQIKLNGKMYSPQEFLKKFTKVPPIFELYADGQPIDLNDIESYVVIQDDSIKNSAEDEHFKTIIVDQKKYTALDVLQMLAKKNPNNLKILHKHKEYSPAEYLKAFEPIPTNFKLVKGEKILKTQNDFLQNLAIERKIQRFPVANVNGKKFNARDTLEILMKNNKNNLKVYFDEDVYTVEEYLSEFGSKISDFIQLVKDGEIVPPENLVETVGAEFYYRAS